MSARYIASIALASSLSLASPSYASAQELTGDCAKKFDVFAASLVSKAYKAVESCIARNPDTYEDACIVQTEEGALIAPNDEKANRKLTSLTKSGIKRFSKKCPSVPSEPFEPYCSGVQTPADIVDCIYGTHTSFALGHTMAHVAERGTCERYFVKRTAKAAKDILRRDGEDLEQKLAKHTRAMQIQLLRHCTGDIGLFPWDEIISDLQEDMAGLKAVAE